MSNLIRISNFNTGVSSNPYAHPIEQGMKGNTYIMNPSPNVGNPYNLINKKQPTYPTRIRTKTPKLTLGLRDLYKSI